MTQPSNQGLSVSLSGDKAFFFYLFSNGEGQLKVYKLNDVDSVSLYLSKTLLSGDQSGLSLNVASASQFNIKMDCMCGSAIQKLYCFSQTLNCIILSKATEICQNSQTHLPNFLTVWLVQKMFYQLINLFIYFINFHYFNILIKLNNIKLENL